MAINLPYYVRPGDIYSQIMGQQQAAPRTLADYYPGFTGGYDTSLYAPKKQAEGGGGGGTGLLDLGGGMGGDLSAMMGSTANPADTIALGQALQGYGQLAFAPGAVIAGLLGQAMVNSGITALGEMESQAATDASTAATLGQAVADAFGVAYGGAGFNSSGAGGISGVGGNIGDALTGGSTIGIDALGPGGPSGDVSGGSMSGADHGAGIDGSGMYAKGGKVTMRGLLVDETLPGPDDGYAALQAGEYVIKKSTTKKLGDKKLQALNEGRASIKMRKE